ncbi:MAG: 3-hydroxyacyl-CoA dehydrogenase NAD-binding domain-containing protein [Actinomycetota bacterium]
MVGAGTMGSGIAQVACLGGFETLLHDSLPDALAAGMERTRASLAKGAERQLWSAEEAEAAAGRLAAAAKLHDLEGCELIIEAAPEDLTLKQELLGLLATVCGSHAVLATNTSSLSVAAIAAGVPDPHRIVGMHFFNPPALMKLVEVVAGPESSDDALLVATEAAEQMGRTPVRAADEIGFIGNRCARPFSLEALRLLGDRIADVQTIDRICRLGGGFRMGPFELMDLVGVDVNFEVAKSFWEQSFHEPRWQPHPIQARMVAAGRLGRKSGRGYYDYSGERHRPEDPPRPDPGDDAPAVEIVGEGQLADELRERAPSGEGATPLILLAVGSRAELDDAGTAVGFHLLPPLDEATLVELTAGEFTPQDARDDAERFFTALGLHFEWVGDVPGLVLGRIVSQLVNEAAFALQKGVGSAEDVDTALRLGFNYPRGPLEWGDEIGLDHVLAVLDGLREELGEERYRAAPLLRGMVADGRLGRSTGGGFFLH